MVNIKLGTAVEKGFYPKGVSKEITQIQKDKMPHKVLQILSDKTEHFPIFDWKLEEYLLDEMPHLSVSKQTGKNVALGLLLKDFKEAELVSVDYSSTSPKIKITPLGKRFLSENIIEK